jgi:tRNA (guanine-N7-)-methyltransferase
MQKAHGPLRSYGRIKSRLIKPRQAAMMGAHLPELRLPREPFDPLALMPGANEVWLEIGFGAGEHMAGQALAHPDVLILGAEPFRNGVASAVRHLIAGGQTNVRLHDSDARDLVANLPDGCISRVFILFPDPWPKARHAKRRFVHAEMLPIVARALKPGCEWRIASDDPTYQAWVEETLRPSPLFSADEPARDRPPGWPPTRYEAKAIAAGRTPLYWVWRRG